jgi:hypothetical protein
MRFLGFSYHEKGAPMQEISKWSTVCNTFSRCGWSVVRIASLAKGGTSKKRPSSHLNKVATPSNEVSPRNLQTARVYKERCFYKIVCMFMIYIRAKFRMPLCIVMKCKLNSEFTWLHCCHFTLYKFHLTNLHILRRIVITQNYKSQYWMARMSFSPQFVLPPCCIIDASKL